MAVNRLMDAVPDAAAIAQADVPADLKRKLRRNLADFAALKDRESLALDLLRASIPAEVPLIAAAELRRARRSKFREMGVFA